MLWIIDGLIYGFFTALYTLVNQHYKFNGYLLGIWRGFGISFFFLPFLFFLPVPDDAYYYFLLIFQAAYMIHICFLLRQITERGRLPGLWLCRR